MDMLTLLFAKNFMLYKYGISWTPARAVKCPTQKKNLKKKIKSSSSQQGFTSFVLFFVLQIKGINSRVSCYFEKVKLETQCVLLTDSKKV